MSPHSLCPCVMLVFLQDFFCWIFTGYNFFSNNSNNSELLWNSLLTIRLSNCSGSWKSIPPGYSLNILYGLFILKKKTSKNLNRNVVKHFTVEIFIDSSIGYSSNYFKISRILFHNIIKDFYKNSYNISSNLFLIFSMDCFRMSFFSKISQMILPGFFLELPQESSFVYWWNTSEDSNWNFCNLFLQR